MIGGSAWAEAAPIPSTEAKSAPIRYCRYDTDDRGWPHAVCISSADYFDDVCRAIGSFADEAGLPRGYFARLIWQESRFDAGALSTAGAEGIAQFMPSTGALRGLRNAFDPAEALATSATYLRDLTDKFGNLGLAAAAYNGGEGRMSRFVANGGYLPAETQDYVQIITGATVDDWTGETLPTPDYELRKDMPFQPACVEMAKAQPMPNLGVPPAEWRPWGVLIAQDFSRNVAQRRFDRVQSAHPKLLADEKLMMLSGRNLTFGTRRRYFALIGRDTRDDAIALCRAISADGGVCLVKKSQAL